MHGERVLLSEGSSLTARETLTVLGRRGVQVEIVSASSAPIAQFSRWCRRLHHAPAPATDPVGYLAGVDALMATGRFTALIPTHEQAWLFAAGRRLLPHARVAVADIGAFGQLESKVRFARLLDHLALPQPAWAEVQQESDLDRLGFPVWVKAAFSTAGRGVRHVHNHREAVSAWHALRSPDNPVMVQQSAPGRYRQVQAIFDHGRLVAAAVSEQLATGVGGSAAARLSVGDPVAVDAIRRVGEHLDWHGGIDLDFFSSQGQPQFIECNPRTVEPGNAAAAGVNLPQLLVDLATGATLSHQPVVARAGVRTRSTMAIGLGAAEPPGTWRGIGGALLRAVARRGPLRGSVEVLTPVLHDPPSIIPPLVTLPRVLANPRAVEHLAGRSVGAYAVGASAVANVSAAAAGQSG
ncbi:ATP-grasp domain-containing protein [Propionibacterium freudenreichii]|uniref:ATP-grasp domain-containing protein n=1 Tax=Propionibacterium freudenreichii TaxID=1744 RepID=UPI0021A37D95|nr:ATP-grasp domain-containing protein [Propionibacterium freudenreichii]MCT2991930.1 ATP-grasp domain-containing protein [Propionibacterium freudenreichii]